jgi:hypothetical protein
MVVGLLLVEGGFEVVEVVGRFLRVGELWLGWGFYSLEV